MSILSRSHMQHPPHEATTDRLSRHRYAAILGMIALAALALRIWHCAWGLPDIFEEAYPFMKAWGFWNWGGSGVDLNPHFFNYPAFTFYLQWAAQALHYAVGHVFGLYPDLDAFRAAYESDPGRAIVIARSLNAVFDVGTVIALAMLARRLAGSVPSLIVAGLSAVNPLQIQMSQQINVDVTMTFFLVIAVWCMLHIYERGTTAAYIAAGVAIGLAAASKYTAAILLVPLLAAHVLRLYGTRGILRSLLDARLFASVMVAEILFLALNPYMLLDAASFKQGFRFELQHMAAGHFGIAEGSSSIWFYLTETIPGNLGWVTCLAAIGGLATILRQGDRIRRWMPVWIYLAILLALLVLWRMRADRYFLPLLPGIFVLTAAAVERALLFLRTCAADRIAGIPKPLAVSAAVLLGTAALAGEPARSTLIYHSAMGKTDTRTLARQWIRSHFKDDIVVVMAPLGVSFSPPQTAFILPFVSFNFQLLAAFYDARWYVDSDLVIGSDFDRARYRAEPEKFKPFLQYFYDSLEVRWRKLETFETGGDRRGPRIWLFVPEGQGKATRFDESLLKRLDSFPDVPILVRFGLSLSEFLERKGKIAKADQAWNYIASRALAESDPYALLLSLSSFPEEIRAIPRMYQLMRQLAWKTAEMRGAGTAR